MKLIILLLLSFLCFPFISIHRGIQGDKNTRENYTCIVSKTEISPSVNANWNEEIWKTTRPIILSNFMGDRPTHFPETKVKLLYDSLNVYVIFNVSDKYVKATEKEINGKICLDSCVEFFFSPGPDTDRGYFNFEANCNGVFLFEYHIDGGKINDFVKTEDCKRVKIAHSLERNVEKEISEPVEWCLEYSIPFSVLKKYMKVDKPGTGVTWRANFYKCADKTSHPHWLTWAPVDYPRPKFHLPEFFGRLVFD